MRLIRRLLGHPVTGFIVLGVGVFGLALVPLIHWYLVPRLELTPLGEETTSVSTGPGTYFDANTLSVRGPVTMTVTTHIVGDVAAGQATGYAVWNISTTVDTPDSLPLHDPRFSLDWILQRWVADRRTNQPVNCCGVDPKFDSNIHLPFPFVYLQFPFGVGQRTYDYWNPEVKQAFPIHFTGITTYDGHQLYRFTGTVPATKIGSAQVPGSLVKLPNQSGPVQVDETYRDDGTEILVDPTSGIPVHVSQHPRTTFRLPGSTEDRLTVQSATFTTTPASERSVLALVDDSDSKLRLIQDTVPTGALWIGSALVLAGIAVLVRAARPS